MTPEDAELLIEQLGLNEPLWKQYLIYLKNFFTGRFGYSFHYGELVVKIIWDRLPNTILLFTTSIIMSAFVGLFLGKIASWHKGKKIDTGMTIGALVTHTLFLPWLALIMIWVFAYKLGWFPINGMLSVEVWLDPEAGFIRKAADVMYHMVLPTLLVVLMLSSLFGQLNIWTIVVIIALFRWPGVSRVIRAQTLSLKERPFIEAAKVAGASHLKIIFGHIMPNVLPLSFLFMTFRVTSAIITEAALAFLGFGDPGTVSWGMMLQWVWKTGHMFKALYWLLPPGICISLITLSFYMLGRAMDEVLDPRLRKEEDV